MKKITLGLIIMSIVWLTAGLSCNSADMEIEEDNNEINVPEEEVEDDDDDNEITVPENKNNTTGLPAGVWEIRKFGSSPDGGKTIIPVEFERLQLYSDGNGGILDVSHLPYGFIRLTPLITDSISMTACSPDSLCANNNKEPVLIFTLYQQNIWGFDGFICANQITITHFGQHTLAAPTEEDLYYSSILNNVHSFGFNNDEIILYFKEINNKNLMILKKGES
jgi:hypothetical protein